MPESKSLNQNSGGNGNNWRNWRRFCTKVFTFFVVIFIVGVGLGDITGPDRPIIVFIGFRRGDFGLVHPQLRFLDEETQRIQIGFDLLVRLDVAVGDQQLHLLHHQMLNFQWQLTNK